MTDNIRVIASDFDGTILKDGAQHVDEVDPRFPVLLREKVKNQVTVLENFEEMPVPMIKISIFFPQGIPADKEAWFHEKYDQYLNVVDGGNGWLDFTNKGVDKGSALKLLAAKEEFFLEEVLAFGDSENDMAMLKEAGLSYAMNTAREHVKKCADRECSRVNEVLEELIAGRL